jgi:plasmid replication initiation protein
MPAKKGGKKGEALEVISKELQELDAREFRKNAAIIHIPTGKLGLVERKIINVLLVHAFKELPDKLVHHISARFLFEAIGWGGSNDYKKLEAAAENIMSSVMSVNMFNDGTLEWHKVNLVQRIALLKGGIVEYEYMDWLAQRLADPEVWASIDLRMQRQFKRSYSLILYENLIRYIKVGKTKPRSVGVWREILGATADMYDAYRHLNGYVLAPAIEEINTVTDYTVSMVPIKKGRKVEELEFFIERKKQAGLQLEESEGDMELRCELERIGFDADTIRNVTTKDPERALLAARRTREQEAAGKIDGTPAAYFMGIFKRKSEIKLDADKPNRIAVTPAPTESDDDKAKDKRAAELRAAWGKLTDAERETAISLFIADHGATSRIEGSFEFRAFNEKLKWTSEKGWRAEIIIANRDN